MHLRYRFIFYFLIFVSFTTNIYSCDEVTIFDVGQGNCVLTKHKKQAILFDAGSSEHKFGALYHQLFGYKQQRYRFKTVPAKEDSNEDTDDSGTTFSEESSEEETDKENAPEVVDTEEPPKNQTKYGKFIKKYQDQIIENIIEKLPKKKGKRILKALVISHPDEDHYNLVKDIFTDKIKFQIVTVILGGRYEQYNSDFTQWLNQNFYGQPTNTRKINAVIFTGASNGSRSQTAPYARAYCSLVNIADRTKTEKKIEIALEFDDDQNKPIIEILAMNAGHATLPDGFVYVANDDTNANSLVLRLKGKASFIIPGDADDCTWNFIKAYYRKKEEQLETDYFLLSHHGALSNGASAKYILDLFKPKVCFISAGRYAKYHHPRGEVIERLAQLESLEKFSDEEECPISFYVKQKEIINNKKVEKIVRGRKPYTQKICSTLDDGTITFQLVKPKDLKQIDTSRNRKEFIESDQEKDIFFEESDNDKVWTFDEKKKNQKLNKKKKEIIKLEQGADHNVEFFYKHSSQYSLILPENDEIKINNNNVYYLVNLKDKNIFKIK